MARKKQAAKGMRLALAKALAAEPDDTSTHMAYADWLCEQDDPKDRARGEFISVQLALENEGLPSNQRKRLREREAELLAAHQRDWLGELATFLLDEYPQEDWAAGQYEGNQLATFAFRRGWLDRLHVNFLRLDFARALKSAPAARLLRALVLEYIQDTEGPPPIPEDKIPTQERWPGLHPLRGAKTLANVRHFRLGPDQGDDYRQFRCYVKSRITADIVGLMPRLEELYLWCNDFNLNSVLTLPLARLRVLLLYHGEQVHRLQHLDRPTFRHLTHLLIHPHHIGNSPWDEDDIQSGYRIERGFSRPPQLA